MKTEKEILQSYKRMAALMDHQIRWMASAHPDNAVLQNLNAWRKLIIDNETYRDNLYEGTMKIVNPKKHVRDPNDLDLTYRSQTQLDSDEQEHYWKTL